MINRGFKKNQFYFLLLVDGYDDKILLEDVDFFGPPLDSVVPLLSRGQVLRKGF